ncbi:ParA family protein [Lactococcus kimchii]|uniref:ParA family protein n=1 Tax=Lactococcus sp. S-13 TaxID=2507158 RepID=UPI001022A286|nr:ParA family protein [Lactococcus sp. S-13]RZI47849.1 ParA family protein [Lactococcus sp. S-13]
MEELNQAKQLLKERKKAVTIIIGNQKGGVGKTTNTYLIAYTLSKLGIKTLVCDLDPQSNSTKALMLTKSQNSNEIMTIDKTLMWGVQQRNLKDLPVPIIENLDLLPSYIDFEDFAKYLYKNTSTEYEETHLLEPLFEPLKEDYDIILIDVPPLSIEVTSNAVMFSDYVLISLQTQDDSMTGAVEYIKTLVKLKMKYDLGIEVLGALPMLSNSRGSVDKLIIESAKEEWGEDLVFETVIPQMERIKRFSINGITDEDRFDRKVLEMYEKVVSEMLSKLIEFEE